MPPLGAGDGPDAEGDRAVAIRAVMNAVRFRWLGKGGDRDFGSMSLMGRDSWAASRESKRDDAVRYFLGGKTICLAIAHPMNSPKICLTAVLT